MRKDMSGYSLSDQPVQDQWNHLEAFLRHLIHKFIPTKLSRPQKNKPWISREIITLIHRRNRAFTTWMKNKTEELRNRFITLRSEAQRKIRKAHQDYLNVIFNIDTPIDCDKTEANKRFWSYVKSKKKDSCSVSPQREEGVLVSDAVGKASILNRQYCSVFSIEDTSDIPSKGPSPNSTIHDIRVSTSGVKRMLQKLNPQKAAGPDGLSPKVLKELAEPLSIPLTKLFQKSIDTGTVPDQWKKAIVSPIFKKGDKHCPANYRPVSLTSVCCKLCEHIIAKAIMEHLEGNNLLCDNQHGFRKKRSCESQLILFVDELAQSMCDGKQVDVAVMDFSKAFDVVPHKRLLNKLHFYGIRGCTSKWIQDFLTDRTQQVVIDGQSSDTAPVTSGVPQGSVLGPILFLTFINDMPECVKSKARLFADDSIIYRDITSTSDCTDLQNDLKSLERWEKVWGMSFNPSKCHIIHISRKKKPILNTYHLKGTDLEPVDNATYLGVSVSKDLSWHNHIKKVVAKGNRTLGFIKRNIRTFTNSIKMLAYKSLVRPTLEYASSVWSPHQKELVNSIEMVQRRAARYVLHMYQRTESVTEMLKILEWDTLDQRRMRARVVMGYRIIHGLVMIPADQLIPASDITRGHVHKYKQIYTRTNYYKGTFFPSFIPLWNSLPNSVVSATTLQEFKKKLADVHLQKPQF